MARIVIDSCMVQYPMGGMLAWILQYLVGFTKLGHEVYLVERSPYPGSCYDPRSDVMTDDPSVGIAAVAALLDRFGLGDQWCYVDSAGSCHGLPRERLAAVLTSADLFLENGGDGDWGDIADIKGLHVLIDAEPGWRQMLMEQRRRAGEPLPHYDHAYSAGLNIGTPATVAPTAGLSWKGLLEPIVTDLFTVVPPPASAPFTTVMSWSWGSTIDFDGVAYGQKSIEFERFMDLPGRTRLPLEIAVSGNDIPVDRLTGCGWRVRDANQVSATVDTYWDYLRASAGEFSVAKHTFVATNSGWFGDRSGMYLASGRPVVVQDTGFSAHLPCGRGLFAVRTVDEAAAALDEVAGDYDRHAAWARELAREHLDARMVLGRFLTDLGL